MWVTGDEDRNDIEITIDSGDYVVTEHAAGGAIVADLLCEQVGPEQARCPIRSGFVASGNAGNDRLVSFVSAEFGGSLLGGDGADVLDNQSPGPLDLWGGAGDDKIYGGVGGSDSIYGDRDYPSGDVAVGDDFIDASRSQSGGADWITCGRGVDTVLANPEDTFDTSLRLRCESVTLV